MEGNSNTIYRLADSKYNDRKAHIFSLDYYDRDSRGEDEFSRKLVWFYVYGDGEIEDELKERSGELFRSVFEDDEEDWHLLTLYPTNTKGGVNVHLRNVFQDVTEDSGTDYEQVLFRNRNIEENHEIESVRKKVLNLEDSIDIVEDVKGKNVIVVDNVSLSGTSLQHATQELYRAGANRVACIALGLGVGNQEDDTVLEPGDTASEIMDDHEKSSEEK